MRSTTLPRLVAILLSGCAHSSSEEMLWVETKIDGKGAKLCFDTGTSDLVLWRQTADRFGLALSRGENEGLPNGAAMTEVASMTLLGTDFQTRFVVLDMPEPIRSMSDGLLGWRNMRLNIIRIQPTTPRLSILASVPREVVKWHAAHVDTNRDTLVLEIPGQGGRTWRYRVDTGSDRGIALSPTMWIQLTTANPMLPKTMDAFVLFGEGVVAKPVTWVRQFDIGDIVISDVAVTEATQTEIADSGQLDGSLGLAALQRLDLVVDGKAGRAYIRPRNDRPPPYQHNRAGVVFIPDKSEQDRLVACVAAGTPAFEAGLRNGDVLIAIDGQAVSTSDPWFLRKFWLREGNKVRVTYHRGEAVQECTVFLRSLLTSPKAKSKPSHFGRPPS